MCTLVGYIQDNTVQCELVYLRFWDSKRTLPRTSVIELSSETVHNKLGNKVNKSSGVPVYIQRHHGVQVLSPSSQLSTW